MLKYPTTEGVSVVIQVTYQKQDGSVIQKLRKTMLPYKIGETTSMGWKVLNIEREYKNKYYPIHEYDIQMYKNKQTLIKKQQTIELLTKEFKTFMYYLITISIISFLKTIFGF